MMESSIKHTDIIHKIIDERAVKTLFQPIVTIKSNKIMIIEALIRGIDVNSNYIAPFDLFNFATEHNRIKELDRICIETALKRFSAIKHEMKDVLLSININMQSIIESEDNSWFHKLVKEYQIDPKRIIIEILEDSIIDIDKLEKFVLYNKTRGYLIAIDDIGSGYSGLMRVSILKPDIIKIDKSLIFDISTNKSNQIIVKSLTELGHRLGILVTCEGVETVDDSMKLMEIGVDLQQGYYYSRPKDDIDLMINKASGSIRQTSKMYKQYIANRYKEKAYLKRIRTEKINIICNNIRQYNQDELEIKLQELIDNDYQIEFVYILNQSGILITNTMSRKSREIKNTHYIFKPADKGEDFSLKNYFIKLNTRDGVYISSPYISAATGIECVTAAKRFITNDNIECILCVDLMGRENY